MNVTKRKQIRTFPLPRTHCGFPLGNGMLGVLVWGEFQRLCLTVNRADFWDHRAGEKVPGKNLFEELKRLYDPTDPATTETPFAPIGASRPKGAFRNTRLPMGRFELVLRQGMTLQAGELNLENGRLRILVRAESGDEHSLQIALHPRHPALWVIDEDGIVSNLSTRSAWEWVGEALASRGFRPPELIEEPHLSGWVQECPEDPSMAALGTQSEGSLLFVMVPGRDGEKAVESARALLSTLEERGIQTLEHETCQWWTNYWHDIPEIRLPDPFFDHFLDFALFKFAGATSPESSLPSGLQGPWCEEYQMPAWAGDYHFNVNIQQIYSLAFPIGKVAHLLPLFDMLDRCHAVFRENARRMCGINDGLLMTHTIDDRGYACGGIGTGATIDHAVSGWTAQLYWQYYRHTDDRLFLRERAMPFMKGVMRVFEKMLEWDGDVPRLPISISAEYRKTLPNGSMHRVGPNASYQFACMHMLARSLMEAADILGEAPDPTWIRIRERLPLWSLAGERGRERIAIWEGEDLNVSHRHHSHLACIYPFDSIGIRDSQQQKIVERSLERWLEMGMSDWSEWCLPWAAIIQAREGYRESPYLLLKLFRDLFLNEGLASVYQPRFPGFVLHGLQRLSGPLETCEIMQLDGTMGFATAVYEMLVHAHGELIRFFPAVPSEWKEVRFEKIQLPGCLRASGEKANHEIRWIRLESLRAQRVHMDIAGYKSLVIQRNGIRKEVRLPVTLDMEQGECIEGFPNGFIDEKFHRSNLSEKKVAPRC